MIGIIVQLAITWTQKFVYPDIYDLLKNVLFILPGLGMCL